MSKENPPQSGSVSLGDHAQGNITITNGIQGNLIINVYHYHLHLPTPLLQHDLDFTLGTFYKNPGNLVFQARKLFEDGDYKTSYYLYRSAAALFETQLRDIPHTLQCLIASIGA